MIWKQYVSGPHEVTIASHSSLNNNSSSWSRIYQIQDMYDAYGMIQWAQRSRVLAQSWSTNHTQVVHQSFWLQMLVCHYSSAGIHLRIGEKIKSLIQNMYSNGNSIYYRSLAEGALVSRSSGRLNTSAASRPDGQPASRPNGQPAAPRVPGEKKKSKEIMKITGFP